MAGNKADLTFSYDLNAFRLTLGTKVGAIKGGLIQTLESQVLEHPYPKQPPATL